MLNLILPIIFFMSLQHCSAKNRTQDNSQADITSNTTPKIEEETKKGQSNADTEKRDIKKEPSDKAIDFNSVDLSDIDAVIKVIENIKANVVIHKNEHKKTNNLSITEQDKINREVIEAIIKQNPNVNDIVMQAIQKGADVDKVLFLAPNIAITKMALNNGASVYTKNTNGDTALTNAILDMFNAHTKQQTEEYSKKAILFILLLIQDGYDLNEIKIPLSKENTLLVYLLKHQRFSIGIKISKALIAAGVDINRRDQCGYTPLMAIVESESIMPSDSGLEIIQYLLDKGADPNPGLAAAIKENNDDLVNHIKTRGAKISNMDILDKNLALNSSHNNEISLELLINGADVKIPNIKYIKENFEETTMPKNIALTQLLKDKLQESLASDKEFFKSIIITGYSNFQMYLFYLLMELTISKDPETGEDKYTPSDYWTTNIASNIKALDTYLKQQLLSNIFTSGLKIEKINNNTITKAKRTILRHMIEPLIIDHNDIANVYANNEKVLSILKTLELIK